MRRFKSARQAQQFLATHTPIHTHFQPRRRHLSASDYRLARARLFGTWRDTNGSAFVAWRGVAWRGVAWRDVGWLDGSLSGSFVYLRQLEGIPG
jgi:hypothetical protein